MTFAAAPPIAPPAAMSDAPINHPPIGIPRNESGGELDGDELLRIVRIATSEDTKPTAAAAASTTSAFGPRTDPSAPLFASFGTVGHHHHQHHQGGGAGGAVSATVSPGASTTSHVWGTSTTYGVAPHNTPAGGPAPTGISPSANASGSHAYIATSPFSAGAPAYQPPMRDSLAGHHHYQPPPSHHHGTYHHVHQSLMHHQSGGGPYSASGSANALLVRNGHGVFLLQPVAGTPVGLNHGAAPFDITTAKGGPSSSSTTAGVPPAMHFGRGTSFPRSPAQSPTAPPPPPPPSYQQSCFAGSASQAGGGGLGGSFHHPSHTGRDGGSPPPPPALPPPLVSENHISSHTGGSATAAVCTLPAGEPAFVSARRAGRGDAAGGNGGSSTTSPALSGSLPPFAAAASAANR